MNRNQLHAALTEEVRQAFRTYEGVYPAMDLASAIAKDVLGKLAELIVTETPDVVSRLILGRPEPIPEPVKPKVAPWYGFASGSRT